MTKGGKVALGLTVLAAAVGGLFLASSASASSGGGGTVDPNAPRKPTTPKKPGGSTPGGTDKPKPKPTPKPTPGKPKPKPPAAKPRTRGTGVITGPGDIPPGSYVWGTPSGAYHFIGDPLLTSNFIMIGDDCSWVIEGPDFRPIKSDGSLENKYNSDIVASGEPDLENSLAHTVAGYTTDNTVWAYTDYLKDVGYDTPQTIVKIVDEVIPPEYGPNGGMTFGCTSAPPDQWSSEGTSDGMYGWFLNFVVKLSLWRDEGDVPFDFSEPINISDPGNA
jgi:hypothetical protein